MTKYKIRVEAALTQVIVIIKKEWRTIALICWFPFFLLCLASTFESMVLFNTDYRFSSPDQHLYLHILQLAMKQCRFFLWAICLVGIYRHLLKDKRFHISTPPLRKDVNSGKVTLSIPLYFVFDVQVIISGIVLLLFADMYNSGNNLALYYYKLNHYGFDQVRWLELSIRAWKVLVFTTLTQVCLMFPYTALSNNKSDFQNIFRLNNKALAGNRFRVWIVLAAFQICFYIAVYITDSLFSKLLYHSSSEEVLKTAIIEIRYIVRSAEWL